MSDGAIDLKADARAHAFSIPLEDINIVDVEMWRNETYWPYFERLRRDDPVHWPLLVGDQVQRHHGRRH